MSRGHAIQPRKIQSFVDEFDESRTLPDQWPESNSNECASIEECVRHAIDPERANGPTPTLAQSSHGGHVSAKTLQTGLQIINGSGLNSQGDFCVEGRAMVTDVPITYLGYVNRDTGVVEEAGHPLDGRAIEDTILIYPKDLGQPLLHMF